MEEYKALKTPELIREKAKSIYGLYIAQYGPKQINLPSAFVKTVEEKMGNPNPDATIFDLCQGHVIQTMALDTYRKYRDALRKPVQIVVMNPEYLVMCCFFFMWQ